jgi:hypothetical protein
MSNVNSLCKHFLLFNNSLYIAIVAVYRDVPMSRGEREELQFIPFLKQVDPETKIMRYHGTTIVSTM